MNDTINNEDNQFWELELDEDQNQKDLQSWVDKGELVGLVDESQGGVIGYIHQKHANRIAKALNKVLPPKITPPKRVTKEIANKITEELRQRTRFFDVAYNDGKESDPKEYEDDNCLHISRGKVRYCFYNGQDKGRLTKKDIPRFAKMIDDIIENIIL